MVMLKDNHIKAAGGITAAVQSVRKKMCIRDSPYFDGDELELKLRAAIDTLPPKQHQVFLLRHYEELPYSEISELTGTSEGALKASFHHAVNKIKRALLE